MRKSLLPILALLLFACTSASRTYGQQVPDGDFFNEQSFSPAVEIAVATGNGLLASYNGYLLLRNRRRHFAAGAAVILGAVGIAIGSREGANYPTADLAFGAAAVLAGGANILLHHMTWYRDPGVGAGSRVTAIPALAHDGERLRPSLTVRLVSN